jgi:hypothetical protein
VLSRRDTRTAPRVTARFRSYFEQIIRARKEVDQRAPKSYSRVPAFDAGKFDVQSLGEHAEVTAFGAWKREPSR